MGMLGKFCDVKNTFEGKALAVLLSAVLAFSFVNIPAFATTAENGASSDAPVAQPVDAGSDAVANNAAESDQASTPEAPATTETPAAPETPAQNDTPAVEVPAPPAQNDTPAVDAPEPPADQPSVEVGVAVVKFDFTHTYVKYLDQTIALPAESVNVPLNKEFVFSAHADEGFEIDKVKTISNAVETELVASENGEYKVPADQVTSNLTLKVEGKAVATVDPVTKDPAAKPLDPSTPVVPNAPELPLVVDDIPGYFTVNFISGDKPFAHNQIIESGYPCQQPINPPLPEGFNSFLGWFQQTGVNDEGKPVLAAERYDFTVPVTADSTLVAQFSSSYLVSFLDADGKVIDSKEVVEGGTVDPTKVPITAPAGTVFDDYWTVQGQDTEQAYDFASPVTSNVTLAPHFSNSYYVYFISNGTAVNPQTVIEGERAVEPETDPTRKGYSFVRWSLSENGAQSFDFNTPIGADTPLYAVWQGEMVNYTVVYWFEKPNIVGDPGKNVENYMYNKSESRQGTAGLPVTLEKDNLQDIEYGDFINYSNAAVISGNGTTVVNAYFKRIVYTIEFKLNGGSMTLNATGETYSDGKSSTCGFEAHTHTNKRGSCYKNGKLTCKKTEHTHSFECYSAAKSYSFEAKYEQDIDKLWVSSKNATFSKTNGYNFTKWNDSWASHRPTLTSDMIKTANDNKVIACTAQWSTTKKCYVNYWLEVPDLKTNPDGSEVQPAGSVKRNGKFYFNDPLYSQDINLENGLSAKLIEGFTNVKPLNSNSDNIYNFYYDRLIYDLSFDSMGGTPVKSVKEVKYGASLANRKPADPTSLGYTFAGWYLDAEYHTKYDFATETMPNSNLRLFAKWESSAYTASFYDKLGDEVEKTHQGVAPGGYVQDPGTYAEGQFYQDCGVFLGWYWYLPGTSNTKLIKYSWETPTTADVKLYAQWRTDGFKLSYEGGESTGEVPRDSNTYDMGVSAYVENALLKPLDSAEWFVGWQKDGKGTTYYPGNLVSMQGDTTLVARFVDLINLVSLTYKANYTPNAPGERTWSVSKNESVSLAEGLFTRDGYSLAGWATTPDAQTPEFALGESYKVEKDTILYAVWETLPTLIVNGMQATKTYNGLKQSYNAYTITDENKAPVEGLQIFGMPEASGTDVGTYTETGDADNISVFKNGIDVTSKYRIAVGSPMELKITQKMIIVQASSTTKAYGTTLDASELTYALGTAVNGETSMAMGSLFSSGCAVDAVVGSYAVAKGDVNLVDNGTFKARNYQIDYRPGTLQIVEADYTLSAYDYTGTYDATPHGIVVDAPADAVVTFDTDNAYTDAIGKTAVKYTVTRDNYKTITGEQYVTINKRQVSLTSENATKTYDGSALVNAIADETGDGFVAGQKPSYAFTGTATNVSDTRAGNNEFTYALPEGVNADNYVVTIEFGTLSITPAPLEVTVTGASEGVTFNGEQHEVNGFTTNVDGKANISLKDGVLAHAEGTQAATYPMNLTSESFTVDAPNYTVALTVIDGYLTINPAKLLIAANDASKAFGQADPELTATITGLVEGDTFNGSYNVTRAKSDLVGSYPIAVENVVSNNSNYVVETAPGTFTIVAAVGASLVVSGGTKVYDGTPLVPSAFTPSGLASGDYAEVVYSGSQTNEGQSVAGIESFIIRNAAGEDVTTNYANVGIAEGTLTVMPATATLIVSDATKVAGTTDPAFSGTVAGLVSEGDLGVVSYARTNTEEAPGEYAGVLNASYTANPNYTVTVQTGTFTITAAPTPPTPVTPGTPPTPGTPVTPPAPVAPAPGTPTPGTVPAGPLTPIIAPIVDALQGAVETVIAPTETPLAGPEEQTIGDNANPLAGFDRVTCWVHYYLILGIVISLIYGVGVLVRRSMFTRKLKGYEDDVLGIEDESETTPVATPVATEGKEA